MNAKRLFVLVGLVLALGLSLGGLPSGAAPAVPTDASLEVAISEVDAGRSVVLDGGKLLAVTLDSNLSTGFAWHVAGLDAGLLRPAGDEWLPGASGLLGAPGTQVLRFAGLAPGRTRLELAYRRAWEAAAPLRTFSVDVTVVEPSRLPPPEAPAAAPAPAAAGSTLALPANYNWCDLGGCTPIRDQGSCGSCWAFGTVGPLESNILIKDGVSRNLAEQYLVSCNTEGWGCNGGWWGHDYHEWKIPPGELQAGAVWEADFPYTATDAPCNPPHPHHETLADWVYIGTPYTVPSVDAMKQAILDHGPISAAVCVNSAFQAYSGGVFTGPSCTSINHAITLVGWDDARGAWRLRNSWNTWWGEGGYMWIGYGVSQVGYNATYVVYQGQPTQPPAAPTGLSASAVSAFQINLAWADNSSNEAGFAIERGPDGANFSQIATVGAGVTGYANTGLSPETTYYYRVRAYNAAGNSGYSNTAWATTPPVQYMHTSDIAWSVTRVRNKYQVTATVTIQDQSNVGVAGAAVAVRWTLPNNKTKAASGTTNANGSVPFSLTGGAGLYKIQVTGVTKSGYVYQPGGDSSQVTVP